MVPQGNLQTLRWPRAQGLDPFAGGGANPLEAIRLGGEFTALYINRVVPRQVLLPVPVASRENVTEIQKTLSLPTGLILPGIF